MGTNQKSMGTNQKCMGTNQKCMGTNQKCMGTNQKCMGTNDNWTERDRQSHTHEETTHIYTHKHTQIGNRKNKNKKYHGGRVAT